MPFKQQSSSNMQSLSPAQKIYLFSLILFAFVVQLFDPIRMGDTDMWYHLSDGRYFWTTGQIANSYFYSFFPQTGEWFNHFWGFQALIYKIYELSGYQGLVITRSVLHLLIIASTAYFIFCKQPQKYFFLKIILFLLLAFLIQGRTFQLRPHLFSYIMIPVFLVLLEKRRDLILLLPVFAAIWVNTHAIEWVIAALICGAYFLEELFFGKKPLDKRYLGIILITPAALLLSPDTIELIKAPFAVPEGFNKYIGELQAINHKLFYSVEISLKLLSNNTVFTLLFYSSLTGIFFLVIKKRLRFSHLILSLASFYLLSKGNRFIWEWALLNLPLLVAAINNLPTPKPITWKKNTTILLIALGTYPFYLMSQLIYLDQPYPFSPENLPVGIVEFLKKTNAKGNLIAHPTTAGFIQEQLYPSILIHSDMKSDSTMFLELGSSLTNKIAMKSLTKKYQIDFIFLVNDLLIMNDAVKDLGYVPVFLDDTGFLYTHPTLQEKIARNYELKTDLFSPIEKADKDIYYQELDKILDISPNHRVLLLMIMKHFMEKEYDEALKYAEIQYEKYPYSVNSPYWMGNIFENQNKYLRALQYYEEALLLADDNFRLNILKQIGTCYYLLEDFEKAYNAFDESINIFKGNETIEDMFQFAFSAIIVGELDKSKLILSSIIQKAPEDKEKIRQSAIDLLNGINAGTYDAPGFFNWLFNTIMGNPIQ